MKILERLHESEAMTGGIVRPGPRLSLRKSFMVRRTCPWTMTQHRPAPVKGTCKSLQWLHCMTFLHDEFIAWKTWSNNKRTRISQHWLRFPLTRLTVLRTISFCMKVQGRCTTPYRCHTDLDTGCMGICSASEVPAQIISGTHHRWRGSPPESTSERDIFRMHDT